jgi:polysaccharide biosynthesis transport protein
MMEPKEYAEEIDFQKYWLVMRRRWLPAAIACGTTLGLATLLALLQEPHYEAEGKLLIRSSRTSALTGLGEALGQLEALGFQNSPLDTQAEIIRSAPVLREVIQTFKLVDTSTGEMFEPEDFVKKLTIKGVAGTDILRVSYANPDAKLAADVVNRLIDVYIRTNLESNRAEASAARKFIARQLPKTEESVRQADSALRRFRESNSVVVLEQEASEAVRLMANLETQLTTTQAQLSDASARVSDLQSQMGLTQEQALAFTSLSQAPAVQEAFLQSQQAQSQLAVERTRYQDSHPTVRSWQRRSDALNQVLEQRVAEVVGNNRRVLPRALQIGELQQTVIADFVKAQAEQAGLGNRLTSLTRARASYRDRAAEFPRLEQQQRELTRKLQAAQETYATLLTRMQAVQLAENQAIANASVVSLAYAPNKPVGFGKPAIIAAGGVIGVLLGITTAFAMDLADRRIKTVKEARDLLKYTLLGVVPDVGKAGRDRDERGGMDHPVPQLVVRDLPRSSFSDAYHMLQANLKFLNSDGAAKTLVVTSSVPREGRSEIAANLAAAMAQVGRRVLLVDADMRHPCQHHVWDLMNVAGLSNVIVDQVSFDAAVQQAMPNLHVLTSGVMPPNPIALLDSKRMAALVKDFARNYDFVVFDTPPLAGIADASVLGKMVDGLLLVVRPGVVDIGSATAAKEFLTQTGQNVMGMVINGVDYRHESDSYFYYGGNDQVENDITPRSTRSPLRNIVGALSGRNGDRDDS